MDGFFIFLFVFYYSGCWSICNFRWPVFFGIWYTNFFLWNDLIHDVLNVVYLVSVLLLTIVMNLLIICSCSEVNSGCWNFCSFVYVWCVGYIEPAFRSRIGSRLLRLRNWACFFSVLFFTVSTTNLRISKVRFLIYIFLALHVNSCCIYNLEPVFYAIAFTVLNLNIFRTFCLRRVASVLNVLVFIGFKICCICSWLTFLLTIKSNFLLNYSTRILI